MQDWWLDELAHAGAEHLDSAYVAGYERKAGYDPGEDIDALRRHGLDANSTLIDLGAGSGVFAAAVAPFCAQVIAADVSPAMTAALRVRVAEGNINNVTVVNAGFLSYEHDGPAVDFVFTRNALHQLPDFWKGIALGRVGGMLRPGGILRLRDLVFDFEPTEAGDRIDAWFGGATTDSTRGWTASELAEHVRSEYSTYSWLMDELLRRTNFEIVERSFRRSAYGTYTCRRSA